MVMERTSASLASTTFKRPLLLTNFLLSLFDFCPMEDLSNNCHKQHEALKLFDIVGEGCSVTFVCFYDTKTDCVEELFKYHFSHFVQKVFPLKDLLAKEKGDDQWTKTISVDFSKCQVE